MVENKRSKLSWLFALSTAILLSGCGTTLMDPKGQIGMEQKTLILLSFGLMLIVVIPVIIMTLVFAYRYRASNKDATYTPNWSHSNKIEAVVWIVPCIIILILGIITWKTAHSLDPRRPLQSNAKPITIEVMSLDWKWLFIYPEQGIATVNQIAFPANVPVVFKITSDTVMNSFFIPQLGSQLYSMAGMVNTLHLIANEPGTYQGISSNYSGAGFSGMKFTAIATATPEEFNQWVKKVKQSPLTLKQDTFDALTKASHNNPVEYFSTVQADLYKNIVAKYEGWEMTLTGLCTPPTQTTVNSNHKGAAE